MIPDPNDEILEIQRRLSARFGNDVHRIAEETGCVHGFGHSLIGILAMNRRKCKQVN
jgi:hypothetical protein